MKIVECVPNFSEGRRVEVVKSIAAAVETVPGVRLLDTTMDPDHNRAVLTFVGEPEAVKNAAFAACKRASELIDLTKHAGEHPRVGATDVIPFVPLKGATMEECVALARELAAQIAEKLEIPTYLYEEAAVRPWTKNLAEIRRGGFEGMFEKIQQDRWAPDFGPRKVHPTAGVTVVGARMPLIAFNINLGTSDVTIAKRIAKLIRESSGGLKNVKAIGVMLKAKNLAQVSINMINHRETSLYRVFEMVKIEAARYGVPVVGSEIIGLVPAEALLDAAEYYLKLNEFSHRQVLENRLYE